MPPLIAAAILWLLVAGCSDDSGRRLYTDPITGEKADFEFIEKDGWTVYTGYDGRVIMLSKGGSPILYVSDAKDGREITIHSGPTLFGAVDVKDKDYDGLYDEIKYRNDRFEVSDKFMDGEIESILDLEDETMRVNYQGQLYQLLGQESEKYVIANAQRIDLRRENNQFVPVGEPTPNKALNADP